MRLPKIKIEAPTAIFLILLAVLERDPAAFIPIVAAVVHECGHLLVMLLYRVPVDVIEISLFGADIRGAGLYVGVIGRAAIYFAGAGANIVTGVAVFILFGGSEAAMIFVAGSACLAVLNLIPVRGLDGGMVLECICQTVAPLYADAVLNVTSVLSLAFLWLAAVYLMLFFGGNISLMLFCMFMFVSLYLR